MPRPFAALSILNFLLALACGGGGGGTASPPPPPAPAFALTVNAGSASGSNAAGSTIHVYGNPPGANQVFDRWSGDTSLLSDAASFHATLIAPATGSATLTATYRSAPDWTHTAEDASTIPGLQASAGTIRVWHRVFPGMKGLILRFHGTNGGAAAFFVNAEDRMMADDAVAAGYGVVALDSWDRVGKVWDTPIAATNKDLANVLVVLNTFKARGWITQAMPLFTHGFSNGGGFAPIASHLLKTANPAWNVRATSSHNTNTANFGQAEMTQMFQTTTVPSRWHLGEGDHVAPASASLPIVQGYVAGLTARGIEGAISTYGASPVYPNRFWRIGGLSASDSQAIHAALKAAGHLDSRDLLVANPRSLPWANAVPAAYRAETVMSELEQQLDACWSEHQFASDFNAKVLAFFTSKMP
jgi:hypothetical protein